MKIGKGIMKKTKVLKKNGIKNSFLDSFFYENFLLLKTCLSFVRKNKYVKFF